MHNKWIFFNKIKHLILPILVLAGVALTLIVHRGNINGELPVDLPDTPAVGVMENGPCQ